MQIKDLSEWEKSLDPIIDAMDGRPLNIHSQLANHPALLQAWWPLRMYLVNGGDLGQRDCELVILRIAAHLDSWYEWASHVVRGLDSGLSLAEIEDVRNDDAAWNDQDAVLLAAVDDISAQGSIRPDTLERLTPHFTNQQVLDIMHLHGMYSTIGCVINTWGMQLDEHIAERLPESVTEEAFAR